MRCKSRISFFSTILVKFVHLVKGSSIESDPIGRVGESCGDGVVSFMQHVA